MISETKLEELARPGAMAPTAECVRSRPRWLELREGWNRLAAASAVACPMLSHEWFTLFIDNFAPTLPLRVTAVFEGEELTAAAPLAFACRRNLGVPYGVLQSLSNFHSQRFDLLARDTASLEALWNQLRSTSGWELLELRDVPDGGQGERLARLAARDGWLTGRWESMRTPFVPLLDAPALSAKFRQNLRRRRRHLEEQGPVRLVECQGGVELDGLLEQGLALEAAGWKGARGTAIGCDPATRGFYRELAHEAARQGWLALFALYAGDRLAAFHFGLRHGGRYYLPKPAYDEGLGPCSPGQLLVESVLQRSRELGLSEFDFLGPSMPWKRDWTTLERTHAWHFIYRPNPLGRALHAWKTEITPRAKRWSRWALGRMPWKP